MFSKLLNWVKEWIGKMLSKDVIKNKLGTEAIASNAMVNALNLWALMYVNTPPYTADGDIKTMGLPAAIASEVARAATIEMAVNITGGSRAKFLQEQLNRFLPDMRRAVEYGEALGGFMLKPFKDGMDNIQIDIVQADQFYPTAYDGDKNITACIFTDQRVVGKYYITRLEYHELNGTDYRIVNRAYRSTTQDNLGEEVSLSIIEDWADIEPVIDMVNMKLPLFTYYRCQIVNNVDTNSPLGASRYSRAAELIEEADRVYSGLLWELRSSERRLYVDEIALKRDDDGKVVQKLEKLIRTLDMGGKADELFKEWSPTIREQNYLNALNGLLKKIEFISGLAFGTISDPEQVDKTATEIKAAKQRSATTITDTQKEVQRVLARTIEIINQIADLDGLAPRSDYTVTFAFDDSLIVDSSTQKKEDLILVNNSIMTRTEFRIRNFGEDEATAKKMIALVDQERSAQFNYPIEE